MKQQLRCCRIEDLEPVRRVFQSPFWASVKGPNGWRPLVFRYGEGEPFLVLMKRLACFSIAYVPSINSECIPHNDEAFNDVSMKLSRQLPGTAICIRYDSRFSMPAGASRDFLSLSKLRHPGFALQPVDTVILVTSAAPVHGFRTRGRRAYHHALNHGVTCFADTEKKWFSPWYELYIETSRRAGFSSRSREYLQRIACYGGHDVKVLLFCAVVGGSLASGALVAYTAHGGVYLYGASSALGLETRAMYALQEFIIRYLHHHGCGTYDLYGISPEDAPGHHLASLTCFKTAFGGRRERFLGLLDYPLKSIPYTLYSLAEAYRISRARGGKDPDFLQH